MRNRLRSTLINRARRRARSWTRYCSGSKRMSVWSASLRCEPTFLCRLKCDPKRQILWPPKHPGRLRHSMAEPRASSKKWLAGDPVVSHCLRRYLAVAAKSTALFWSKQFPLPHSSHECSWGARRRFGCGFAAWCLCGEILSASSGTLVAL
jgi:hypothetical protein